MEFMPGSPFKDFQFMGLRGALHSAARIAGIPACRVNGLSGFNLT